MSLTTIQSSSQGLEHYSRSKGLKPSGVLYRLDLGTGFKAIACGLVGLVILDLLLDISEYLQCTPESDYTLTGPTVAEYMILK